MSQDFSTALPSKITMDILSRLPTRTIVRCKCVCKPWLHLLESDEFAKHHAFKSVPGLAILLSPGMRNPSSPLLKLYEFEDELGREHHELRYNSVTTFGLPKRESILIQGSANGLLFLRDLRTGADLLYVCNPITRDCIQIDCPQTFVHAYPQQVTFGFGTSRTSGEHKVVRVFQDCRVVEGMNELVGVDNYECHVYTLGTGSWRSIAVAPPPAPFVYSCRSIGTFFNGNLHWFVIDVHEGSTWISCFDLETEAFSAFPAPPGDGRLLADTFAFEDRLCVCDNTSDDEIVIWMMGEYGSVEKSWSKKFVISKTGDYAGKWYVNIRPIKVFEDGDILMAWEDFYLFYYSGKTKALAQIDFWGGYHAGATHSIPYSSSFLSLKGFTRENFISF